MGDRAGVLEDGSPAHRDAVRSKLTPDAVRHQYVAGTRDPSQIDPDNWTIDSALLARPGVEVMAGMPVEVLIKTGKFTAAGYMLRPVMDSFNRAFRED